MGDTGHDQDDRLGELRALGDEIRVRIHLAGMEAKDKWNDLEARLGELEQNSGASGAAAHAAREAMDELERAFRMLRDSL